MPWFGPTNRGYTGDTSGQLVHNNSFSVAGPGFGTQSGGVAVRSIGGAAVGSLDSGWTGGWPSTSTPAVNNLGNQNVGFSPTGATIGAPHPYVSRIMTGCHYTSGVDSSTADYNVMAYYTFTAPSFPYCFYIHHHERNDPNWVFSGDNNYKFTDFTNTSTPYGLNEWITVCNGGGPPDTTTALQYAFDPGSAPVSIEIPDANGHGVFWGNGANPFNASNGWLDKEMMVGVTSSTGFAGGYINHWESGTQLVNYVGRTDNMSGTTRCLAIGGYSRTYPHATNFRYFSDVFMYISATGTFTPSLCLVCNASTYAASTIRVPQVPNSWSDSTINFNFWKGILAGGSSAYVIVKTAAGGELSRGPFTVATSP